MPNIEKKKLRLSVQNTVALGLLIVGLLLAWATQFDAGLYQKTIVRVDAVQQVRKVTTTDDYTNHDEKVTQSVRATIQNNADKGQVVTFKNTYTRSGMNDLKMRRGQQLFIEWTTVGKQKSVHVVDQKRDRYFVLMVTILLVGMLVIGGGHGFRTLLSLGVNILLVITMVHYSSQDSSLPLLAEIMVLAVLATGAMLLFLSGWNKKSVVVGAVTLLTTFCTFLLGVLVLMVTQRKGLHFEEMEFLTRPYYGVYLSGLFIGSLGAVMDVAITIVTSLFRLHHDYPTLSRKKLRQAGQNIGQDILGAMITILFFTYVSGAIPLLVLYLRNQMFIGYSFSIVLSLEISRALIGAIGIALAVPFSIWLSVFYLKKKEGIDRGNE